MGYFKNTSIPKKYLISDADRKEIMTIIRRTIKVLILILSIKLLRIYLSKSGIEQNELILEILAIGSPVELVKFLAINIIGIGVIGLIVFYLIMGTSLLKKKLFYFLFFALFIEGIYMHTFPEIHIAIIKAIFTIP